QLVNQIAAGEVIERPASVVKELLENAIDAQATRILLELQEAGKKLIRASDDGTGIPAAEAPLALSSHATSKIASAEDLDGITSLGFRGEALASIASVADVRLVTRTADALEAVEIAVSAGKAEPPRPTSGPVGTTIEVRNLFRYVPARRKFLKTDATEMGHITEQVTRLALAYPNVHLAVTHNGRTVYELPPTDSIRDRVAVFFGEELAQGLLEIASEEPAGRLLGLIGPPHLARATTQAQYLFLNGRYVRDRSLSHALREAYRGLLEGGRQPVAFLFLTIQPDRVDVNVHPTKIEVRLRDGHLLYGQMLAAVRGRLLGPGITPHIAAPPGESPQPGQAGGPAASDAERDARVRQAVAEFLRSPQAAAQSRLLFSRRADEPRPGAPREAGAGDVRPPVYSTGANYGMPGEAGAAAPREPDAAPPPVYSPGAKYGEPDAAPMRAVQLHNTYLVAETADGILIVDQHALHERIIFEEIMARLEAGPLEAQRFLLPVTASLTDREIAAIDEHREALAHLGIEAEAMGPRTVAVHAFPMLLGRAEPTAVLRDFLAWAIALDAPPTARQVLEKLAHVAACRAAVKAGDPLKHEEIEALLARRAVGDLAATCPHGRPTSLVLSKSDLEKQFGRDYAAPPKNSDEPLPF
ncbi:MAG: DNA mismatch repair endonuclease MutL, partial [Planctomycetota bacterium]|nr:DNA mismatch repair endonuclease MutL [Planctomycetota bacterium]